MKKGLAYADQLAEIEKWVDFFGGIDQNLHFSGERVVIQPTMIQNSPVVFRQHVARYLFAGSFVCGRMVCDAACGTGYGAKILQESGASRVVGVDISPEAISAAQAAFGNESIGFETGNVRELPFEDKTFDAVVSFETIEHVDEPEKVIDEMSRVLKRGGKLIISTPNRRVERPGAFFEEQATKNSFHKHEFTVGEFVGILTTKFSVQHVFGQWPVLPVEYRDRIDRMDPEVIKRAISLRPVCFPLHSLRNYEPRYILAVCAKK